MKITKIITAIFLIALISSCANQTMPTGGPVDTTPPEITAMSLKHGQLNVDKRAVIAITFSKWINQISVSGAISVFPPLPKGFVVKASRNRITIIPREALSDNTTYHVIIGTSLQDLRNNALKQPINIVFSTGTELDGGILGGTVVSLEQLIPLPRVALYREDGEWTDARYFSTPDYMVHCDSAGKFKFSYLREGQYRIVAFDDRYRIGRLRLGDTCFTSLEHTITVTRETQKMRLYPAMSDTVVVADTVIVDSMAIADSAVVDTIITDAAIIDTVIIDTAVIDTVAIDTIVIDTTIVDTAMVDVAVIDTAVVDIIMADTIDIATSNDNICYRLSGRADCLEPHDKRKWIYRPIGRKEIFVSPDSSGTFSFDSIPASKGILIWFIDDNNDNLITPGRLSPWRRPERFFVVSDTVEAKAKWEIDGLRIRGCE